MIVILVSELSNGDTAKTFGGIACDVEGCDVFEPPFKDGDHRKSLIAAGWFIEPGKHRCPAHADVDAPGRKPDRRVVDVVTKRI